MRRPCHLCSSTRSPLIGLKVYGPGEKVAWFVNFTYRGEPCVLAYEKFGLRLYLRTEAPEEEARKTQVKVAKQLRSSMRVVEKVIMDAAPELLGKGEATVVNQHRSLRRAYEYFRERALEPTMVEDETIEYGPDEIAGIQCEPLETTSQMAWWVRTGLRCCAPCLSTRPTKSAPECASKYS